MPYLDNSPKTPLNNYLTILVLEKCLFGATDIVKKKSNKTCI